MIKFLKNFIFFILIFYNQICLSQDLKILYKINESIITSHDVKKEITIQQLHEVFQVASKGKRKAMLDKFTKESK